MKKVMITLAAVAMAACTHAAQFYWSFSDIAVNNANSGWTYRTDAQELSGYTLYILKSSDWNSENIATSLDKALVSSEISAANGWTVNENANMVQYMSGTKKATGVEGLTAGTTFDAIFVVANSENYWNSDVISGVSALEDGSIETSYTAALSQNQNATSIAKTDMQAIPEPTSGLLVLLGVAGLALRRKQK